MTSRLIKDKRLKDALARKRDEKVDLDELTKLNNLNDLFYEYLILKSVGNDYDNLTRKPSNSKYFKE